MRRALDELQKLGFMTTPVTVVDEDVVVGFDQKKLSALLNIRVNRSSARSKTAFDRKVYFEAALQIKYGCA